MDPPEITAEALDTESLRAKIVQLVRDHEFTESLRVLQTLPLKKIQSIVWELLPLVILEAERFQLENEDIPDRDAFFKMIEDIHHILSSSSSSKEVLLMNLETLPSTVTLHGFNLVLCSIGECLRERKKYSKPSLVWSLEVIGDTLKNLPPPKEVNYENAEERKLMDVEPEVCVITDRYELFLAFLRSQFTFVNETRPTSFDAKDRLQICSLLLRPLGTTLGLLDLSPARIGQASSTPHVQALHLTRYIETMCDPLMVLELAECRRPKSTDDDLKVDSLSAGVLAYVVVCLNRKFPRVYSPHTLADLLLTLSFELLSSSRTLHVLKGLDLTEEALVYVQCVRKSDVLQLICLRLLKTLFRVMTSCPVQEARSKAMPLWNQLYNKCDPEDQLDLLFLLFKHCEDPSVRGFIVDLWRKQLANNKLEKGQDIVRKLIFLPEKEKTDLLHHSEYLLASLNMLRYLLLHRMLHKIPALDAYLTDFKKALLLSRAHYELQLRADKDVKLDSVIPNVPRDMEKEVLGQALTRFDLMESLLGIVQSAFDSL